MNKVELMLLSIALDELSSVSEKIAALLEGDGYESIEITEAMPATGEEEDLETIEFPKSKTISASVKAVIPPVPG